MYLKDEKTLLNIVGLYKKYEDYYANYDLNLTLYEGEILGLLGPNGAGKTTLVRQISGILKPSAGKIIIDGYNIADYPEIIPKTICSMGQLIYTHRNLTVYEHIYYTGILRGLNAKSANEQSIYLLERFNILNLKNRIIDTLSGGEIRIISFIATIIGFRRLIILDEPTNDMDPEHRNTLWELLKEIKNETQSSILLVTHNVAEAESLVDRVAIIQKGQITHLGTPKELISKASNTCRIVFSVYHDIVIPQYLIENLGAARVDSTTYQIVVAREILKERIKEILTSNINPHIRDIQILLPSLADAYLYSVSEKYDNGEEGLV